jgi:hypothetical protein
LFNNVVFFFPFNVKSGGQFGFKANKK